MPRFMRGIPMPIERTEIYALSPLKWTERGETLTVLSAE
jgi:hypothetical protein